MNKAFLIGLGATTVVVALMAGWWFNSATTSTAPVLKAEHCDLNEQICQIVTPTGQTIQLSFSPKPVPLLSPLSIEAKLSGYDVPPEKLQLVLEGINMYMGFQKAWLMPNQTKTQYHATLQIPSCEETDMKWRITLFMPLTQGLERVEFYMTTHAK